MMGSRHFTVVFFDIVNRPGTTGIENQKKKGIEKNLLKIIEENGNNSK